MVEIRPAELGDQLLEVLPPGRANIGRPVSQIAAQWHQTLGQRNLGVFRLIDIVDRPQDARIGQCIAQTDMNGFQPVERFLAILALFQIEVAHLGNGAQILRQPLPFEGCIASTLPHAGRNGLGIDARATQRLLKPYLHPLVDASFGFAHIGAHGPSSASSARPTIPERVKMRDRCQNIGELALDFRPLGRGRPVDRRFDLADVLRKLSNQRIKRCLVFGHINGSIRLD
jgi:hypothetical protein